MAWHSSRRYAQRESNPQPPAPARPACWPGEYEFASRCRIFATFMVVWASLMLKAWQRHANKLGTPILGSAPRAGHTPRDSPPAPCSLPHLSSFACAYASARDVHAAAPCPPQGSTGASRTGSRRRWCGSSSTAAHTCRPSPAWHATRTVRATRPCAPPRVLTVVCRPDRPIVGRHRPEPPPCRRGRAHEQLASYGRRDRALLPAVEALAQVRRDAPSQRSSAVSPLCMIAGMPLQVRRDVFSHVPADGLHRALGESRTPNRVAPRARPADQEADSSHLAAASAEHLPI